MRPPTRSIPDPAGWKRRSGPRPTVPFGPLDAAVRAATDDELALAVGVTRQTAGEWRRTGRLSMTAADRAACALGYHVLNLWPDYHDRFTR